MIIGITGGTGCGKTTLLDIIRQQGGTVLDCDAIYHELLRSDDILLRTIAERFPGVVTDGVLDRKKLGGIVFSDEQALQDLNQITHSAVKEEVLRRLKGISGVVAIDAIGLFEGGLAELCDVTVAVTAPVEDRVQRLMKRDAITEEYARKRIGAQHSEDWFREKCDDCLTNDGPMDAFATKCLAFLERLRIIEEKRKGANNNDY